MDGDLTAPDARKERALQRRRRLERRLAEAALGRYGLGDAALEPLRLGEGFTQVLRVSARRGEQFVLKLYGPPPPEGGGAPGGVAAEVGERRTSALLRSPEVLASQLGWLSDLGRETGLPVPEPVPLPDGSLLGNVSTSELVPRGSRLLRSPRRRDAEELWGDLRDAPEMTRNFCLLRWVPGVHRLDGDLAERETALVGSYLARLHGHSEAHGVPEGAAFPRWDWGWPFGPSAPLWSRGPSFYSEEEMEVFGKAARLVRGDLERLGHGPGVFGVVHRDPKLENLVFEGGRVGAVDFDMSGLGHYMLDVRVFRASLERRHPNRLGPLWEAFLGGYGDERPLPQDHERYLTTFAVMQRVAAVNRRLELLGSGEERRGVLKNTVPWLRELSRRWGTHAVVAGPYPLTGLFSEELSYAAGFLAML
jgi:Ser/Thr protein kinase RdoA (MazF antagonist)